MKVSPGRRRFLIAGAAVGGGLLLGWGLSRPRRLLGDPAVLPVSGDEVALNAWLKIDAEGTVTVAVPRAEMGQGVYTALPMLVAEELGADWGQVRVVQAPIDKIYGNVTVLADGAPFDPHDSGWLAGSVRWSMARAGRALGIQVTGGSTSVRDAWLPMRAAGAAARDMLQRAAARRLDVPVAELEVAGGMVTHGASGRALAFGTLADEAAQLDPPSPVPLREDREPRLLGKPLQRLDVPQKCDGSALFGIDVRDGDMCYAALRMAPTPGGRVASVDLDAIEARPGVVRAFAFEDAVSVVAESWWQAERALTELPPAFDGGAHATLSGSDFEQAFARALDEDDGFVYQDDGDAHGELQGADVIRAEYRVPLLAHACMEPMNCTARVESGHAEVWCGNQAPDLMRLFAARALDLPQERIVVHTPLLGGGFGRRAEPDALWRALAVARELPGQTVQLIYSREQDMQHDVYRPPAVSRCAARLAGDGTIAAWHDHIASPSVTRAVLGRAFPRLPLAGPDKTTVEGAAFLPYAVPHRRVEHSMVPIPVPVGYWRSVGHSANAFFSESFVDELAAAAGRDPLEFRLAHLAARPRAAHVLTLARELSGWDSSPPAGIARGVALHESFHSIVAQVAEVTLENGRIRVPRVVCVIDCGRVVNPDIVIAQMESGIAFGLSAALYGDVRVEKGEIQQWNFPDYRVVGLREMPRIETHVVESGAAPGGVGEPGTPPIAPAVGNALAALTGVRRRSLPLSA